MTLLQIAVKSGSSLYRSAPFGHVADGGSINQAGLAMTLVILFAIGSPLSRVVAAETSAQPLDDSDFQVHGLTDDSSVATVVQTLGKPLAKQKLPNDFDRDQPIMRLQYDGLEIDYVDPDHILGFTLRSAAWTTTRGLRVGDSVARVRELYGDPAPENADDESCDYLDPHVPEGLHVISVIISNRKVQSIFVGWGLD